MNAGTHESPRELARQSEAKRQQAPQSEANMCRQRRRMQSRKTLPYQLHRTPNNAQNTQHKLGVAFSCLERNKYFGIKVIRLFKIKISRSVMLSVFSDRDIFLSLVAY